MDISMDIHEKSVDMDMDVIFHIHGNPGNKARPKIFAPPQTPFPGALDGQNLISWRWSLPLPTYPVW